VPVACQGQDVQRSRSGTVNRLTVARERQARLGDDDSDRQDDRGDISLSTGPGFGHRLPDMDRNRVIFWTMAVGAILCLAGCVLAIVADVVEDVPLWRAVFLPLAPLVFIGLARLTWFRHGKRPDSQD
jgi:hypothetical protein